MRWRVRLAVLALLPAAVPAYAVPLDGRFDALVDAAAACAAATGPEGVDRASLAAAGWGDVRTAEIDHAPAGWALSERNPFELRITGTELGGPDHCWLAVEFERLDDFARVRGGLEARFRRAPDSVDADDMLGTRWITAGNEVELWMMPAHKLCSECPTMFISVKPRNSGQSADRP